MKHADTPYTGMAMDALRHPALPEISTLVREKLDNFVRLLTRWNSTIRLVSQRDATELWPRHIDDALQLLPMIPPAATHAVDLGSGGGFPGLILAIATGLPFDLIEADGRKAAFLQEAALATKAPVTIHARRIEDVSLPPRDLVTARALAPLLKLLELAEPFLSHDGVCLFPKGEQAEVEISEAEAAWSMVLQQRSSRTSDTAHILHISHLQRRREGAR